MGDDEYKVDSEVNEAAKVVYGNFYQQSQKCSFAATVAKMGDNCVVDVRRMYGDAFLLKTYFDLLKKFLIERELVENDKEDNDEDDGYASMSYDDLFASDDDGDDDDDLNLVLPDLDPHNTMMEFEYDTKFLHMMINGFTDTHMEEQSYFMGLLAYNAGRQMNRTLMLDEKVKDQMKNLLQEQLQKKKDYSNASITRDTSVLLKNLACDMEIDTELIQAASKAVGEWCPGKNSGRRIGELQGSRQALFK